MLAPTQVCNPDRDVDEPISDTERTASIILLPGMSQLPTVVDPERKPGERLPYAKSPVNSSNLRTSGIVHDFNNLLAIIQSHSSIAFSKLPPDHTARSNIERVMRAVRRAADLSGQLLADFNQTVEETKPLYPNESIKEVVELLEPKLLAKAHVIMQLAPDLWPICIPALRLQQVLTNLLLNASESIFETPGQIIITSRNLLAEEIARLEGIDQRLFVERYSTIEIADTGGGMDQSTLDHIFEPYFTTKPTGSGIGLSTTLALIHAHRGVLQVSSTLGQGSSFRVLLPAYQQAE